MSSGFTIITTYKGITDLPTLGTYALTGTEPLELVLNPNTNGAVSIQVQINQIASVIASSGSIASGAKLIVGSPGTLTATPGAMVWDTMNLALWLYSPPNGGWQQLI